MEKHKLQYPLQVLQLTCKLFFSNLYINKCFSVIVQFM